MDCHYYIQSELVIEYIDVNGAKSITKTERTLEKRYVLIVTDEDSDNDEETLLQKLKEKIERRISKNTYKKMLYENNVWVKLSYEKRYKKELQIICPRIVKLVKMYKDYRAWAS